MNVFAFTSAGRSVVGVCDCEFSLWEEVSGVSIMLVIARVILGIAIDVFSRSTSCVNILVGCCLDTRSASTAVDLRCMRFASGSSRSFSSARRSRSLFWRWSNLQILQHYFNSKHNIRLIDIQHLNLNLNLQAGSRSDGQSAIYSSVLRSALIRSLYNRNFVTWLWFSFKSRALKWNLQDNSITLFTEDTIFLNKSRISKLIIN